MSFIDVYYSLGDFAVRKLAKLNPELKHSIYIFRVHIELKICVYSTTKNKWDF